MLNSDTNIWKLQVCKVERSAIDLSLEKDFYNMSVLPGAAGIEGS
jgi:hypothetical protein